MLRYCYKSYTNLPLIKEEIMKQQKKLALIGVMIGITGIFGISTMTNEVAKSNIAEEQSVIDEQHQLKPFAGASNKTALIIQRSIDNIEEASLVPNNSQVVASPQVEAARAAKLSNEPKPITPTPVPAPVQKHYDTIVCEEYVGYAVEVAGLYDNISPELLIAIIETESRGRANVTSSGNAKGLMQIIQKWHRGRMQSLGVTNLYDPRSNILVGANLMNELLNKYDLYTALMCYNEGEYGTAIRRAAQGNYSYYAKKIVNRMNELKK